jgi:mannitol-1-/sugar-/sorbitol-6-phosphatase
VLLVDDQMVSDPVTPAAVLLDVDGVLLDSSAAYARVWSRWAAVHALDSEDVCAFTQGRRMDDTLRALLPDGDHAVERRTLDAFMAEGRHLVRPFEGALSLLRSLPGNGWAIATSGRRASVHRRFGWAGLPLPGVQVCADDVARGKPDPECYVQAARRLGADPARCLVIDDSPAGVAAGKAAGCAVYAVSTTHLPGQLAAADRCYGSLLAAAGDIQDWAAADGGRHS